MTRRLKRTKDFDIVVEIHRDDFIAPPRQAQRSWLLNTVVKEVSDQLLHLHDIAPTFVPGSDELIITDREQSQLDDSRIMEDWQIPVMNAMAELVVTEGCDVLEIGLGRCIAAEFIQARKPATHTIIECNDSVIQRYENWRQRYGNRDIRLIRGRWQDVLGRLATYDGILFHTYPLNEAEYIEQVVQASTFAEHFFSTAASLLRDDGVLTYHTNERDSLSRAHQQSLFRHFSSFTLQPLLGLDIPEDTRDAMWSDRMLLIRVVK